MKVIYAGRETDLPREVGRRLAAAGIRMEEAFDEASATTLVAANGAKVLLLDLELPGGCALSLLERTHQTQPGMSILALVEEERFEKQARAFALGAAEVVALPADFGALAERTKALAERTFVTIETHGHRSLWSEASRELYEKAAQAASSDLPVLITGETGTGKEVVARTIHALSSRRKKPYMAVNCPGLSAGVLESELFGHEKGAYTGATQDREGRFEAVEDGTLVLDEISDIEPALQAKLLRVLQERTFERVGSNRMEPFTGRVIAVTNRDLGREVGKGLFRADLFYRLRVLEITVPALRDRASEVGLFLDYFSGLHGFRIADEARDQLLGYAWPGNVREVENFMAEFAVMGRRPVLDLRHLSPQISEASAQRAGDPESVSPLPFRTLPEILLQAERKAIEEALARCGGVAAKAAELLGVPRTTLRRKARALGLNERAEEPAPGELSAGEDA